MDAPNPLAVGFSIARSLLRVSRPRPVGTGAVDTGLLASVLATIEHGGPASLIESTGLIDDVIRAMSSFDPNQLDADGALGFWIDLYNAGALALAASSVASGSSSVLRVPGGFSTPFVIVAGEALSLDAIEHAKVRRFGDPRIHAALVCGSMSCPTLRQAPYSGSNLDMSLSDQMRSFLVRGGLSYDKNRNVVTLSRVFSWYGADFVRPKRMPTFLPAIRKRVLEALRVWVDNPILELIDAHKPAVEFASYDWGLRCSVG